MCHIPIRSDPRVQAGAQPNVISDPGEEHVSATSVLSDSTNAVILHMKPSKLGAYEPFMGQALGLIGPVRQPEARRDIRAELRSLRAFRTQRRVEILIRNKSFEVKDSRIRPVSGKEEIG